MKYDLIGMLMGLKEERRKRLNYVIEGKIILHIYKWKTVLD